MADMEISDDGGQIIALSDLVHQCNLLSTDAHSPALRSGRKRFCANFRTEGTFPGRDCTTATFEQTRPARCLMPMRKVS